MHERVYDEFVEKAKALALKRVVGDPFKKGVEQGPQVLLSPLTLLLTCDKLFYNLFELLEDWEPL